MSYTHAEIDEYDKIFLTKFSETTKKSFGKSTKRRIKNRIADFEVALSVYKNILKHMENDENG